MYDHHFEALSDRRRREVLLALHAERAGDDAAVSVADLPEGKERPAATALHHTHLPKLEEYGLVDWSRTDEEIRRGPQFGEIEPLLTVLIENRDRISVPSAAE